MRLTRYQLFLLGGLFLMVMGPLAFTQPGGGGKGGRGKMSPDMIFTFMAGGGETFEVAKVQLREWPGGPTAEQQKQQMLTALQKKGITDGVMTKAVFADYWEQRMTEMRAQREAKGTQDGPPATPGAAPAAPTQDVEAEARVQFAIHDTDKNGSLSVEEMQAARMKGSRIYDERDQWDANKNGTIELPEYIEYYKARMARRGKRGNPNPAPAAIPEPAKSVEDENRPIVYRTGKFPKELPAWFEEADKDKDGQIGLYEWKASGKPVREFLAMDLNGDGFLTVEEVLRYQRATAKATPTTPGAPSAGTPDAATSQGGNPRGRGQNGGGRNGGGRNGGAPKGG